MYWGIVSLYVTTADINGFLSELTSAGITIYDVKIDDELSVQVTVKEQAVNKAKYIASKYCNEIKVVSQIGLLFSLKQLFRRPVLVAGILLWLVILLYLPSRVLFVQVEGNKIIPDLLIAEKAERCGITFGCARKAVRNEKIKNALLSEIPELQWVGVNTQGCLAVISVRERALTEVAEKRLAVGHIVASQDGVISDLTVTKGTPLSKVGEAVAKGQVLVSGYTDCGLLMRAEVAEAEIMAITERRLTLRQPDFCATRNQITDMQVDYSIQIGKNIVKLSNSAGIPNANCAKIYTQDYLTLPGGFRLPLALICVKTIWYDYAIMDSTFEEKEQISLVTEYLRSQMLMGQILSSRHQKFEADGQCGLNGIYICEEMIGKLRKEEIG